jgi:collagen type III alpha
VAWDPEGLLKSAPSEGHFARRERERAVQQPAGAPPPSPPPPPPPRPPPGGPPIRALAGAGAEGVAASDSRAYAAKALKSQLAASYMPVDLSYPGLRVLHLDPPVFAVDAFFSPDECRRMAAAAAATGRMAGSKVGGGNAGGAVAAALSSRRTSTSMLLDDDAQAAHPALGAAARDLQARGMRLLGAGAGAGWGRPGRLPAPGQYCFEALQVAAYDRGQLFMEHEDGFPLDLARANRFQRAATLLVYLNDVPAGGATRFEHLGLAVSPRQGMALLFFPAFADGRPDSRCGVCRRGVAGWAGL